MKAAVNPPVSEFPSPKVKIAGKSQVCNAKTGERKRMQNKERGNAVRLMLRDFMLISIFARKKI